MLRKVGPVVDLRKERFSQIKVDKVDQRVPMSRD